MILAGDIGGTHSRLAFFEQGALKEERIFGSPLYPNLEQIVREFLGTRRVDKACFGIAGPIRNGICKATNLPWVIDAAHLSQALGIRSVFLLNDLEANAWGLQSLSPDELYPLHRGAAQLGNQALIAAGTGLGEAGLIWDGKVHRPFACEGGHADFAPRTEEEIELLRYLQKTFSHVSYERVISGPGLLAIFQFLVDTGRETASSALQAEIKKGDPSRIISAWGVQQKDRACARAVDWFISLYGAEAGNLALKFLSLGGLYIGGGIAPRLLERFKEGAFHAAFIEKGRFKDLLASIPVWIVLNDQAALKGAAFYAEGR